MATLQRFKDAQELEHEGFAAALTELHVGRKRGHWIWYIFPQLSGLGSSAASTLYGVADVGEAVDYVRDPVLRTRLIAATTAVADSVRAGLPLSTIMGGRVDALKLISSLTLFGSIAAKVNTTADNAEYERLAHLADDVLAAAAAEGYQRCGYTLRQLEAAAEQ